MGQGISPGELSSLSEWDSIRLDNLGIKTIIDLRTNQETLTAPIKYTKANILQIPISVGKIADAPNVLSRDECGKETPGYIWKTSTCNS